MSKFRAGQRVRVEWGDEPGSPAMEGRLVDYKGDLALDMPDQYYLLQELAKPCDVTVLSEPRPEEPTGLGAVVEAGHVMGGRGHWVRVESGWWINSRTNYSVSWRNLEEPVVLSEGWTPDE